MNYFILCALLHSRSLIAEPLCFSFDIVSKLTLPHNVPGTSWYFKTQYEWCQQLINIIEITGVYPDMSETPDHGVNK